MCPVDQFLDISNSTCVDVCPCGYTGTLEGVCENSKSSWIRLSLLLHYNNCEPIVGSGIAFGAQLYGAEVPASSGPGLLLVSTELRINPSLFSSAADAHASIVIDDGGHSLRVLSHTIAYVYEAHLEAVSAAPFSTATTLRFLFTSNRANVNCDRGNDKYTVVSFNIFLHSKILTLGTYTWRLTANFQGGAMSAMATSEMKMVVTEGRWMRVTSVYSE